MTSLPEKIDQRDYKGKDIMLVDLIQGYNRILSYLEERERMTVKEYSDHIDEKIMSLIEDAQKKWKFDDPCSDHKEEKIKQAIQAIDEGNEYAKDSGYDLPSQELALYEKWIKQQNNITEETKWYLRNYVETRLLPFWKEERETYKKKLVEKINRRGITVFSPKEIIHLIQEK